LVAENESLHSVPVHLQRGNAAKMQHPTLSGI
jgi:hypothetical protein